MARMVTFRYDAANNTAFSEDHAKLETREQVDEFIAEYRACWETLGKRSWLVADIDDLFVAGQVADYYAEESRRIMDRHLLGYARWATNSWARMSVRTTALKAGMPSVIHSSEREALAAIAEMRRASADRGPDAPRRD